MTLKQLLVIAAALAVNSAFADLGEECTTDGGYQQDMECVSECYNTVENPPFISESNPEGYSEPTKTTNETWCATVEDYQTTGSTKKQWGYCYCVPITKEPTAQPTAFESETLYYANYAWQSEQTDCVLGQVYTAEDVAVNVTGCLPTADFTLYSNPSSGRWTAAPSENLTEYWCPTIDNMRLYLDSDVTSNRDELRSWGYCSSVQTTQSPSAAPSVAPTTPVPSQAPVTPAPSAEPTPMPTAFTPEELFTAQDGWLTESTDCVLGEIQTEQGGEKVPVTGCLPVANYSLYIKDSDKFIPSNNTYFCPTIEVFKTWLDPSDSDNKDRLKSWGYCTSELSTREPSAAPSTAPTTGSPSASPTSSPTAFVPEITYYATGGGVGVSSVSNAVNGSNVEPCLIPFTIKGSDVQYTSCAMVTDANPNMVDDSVPGFPAAPIEGTNTSYWCPIGNMADNDNNYNNQVDKGKSDRWGYCFSVESTREPTMGEQTASPSMAPVVAVNPTVQPTAGTNAPTTTGQTSNPTSSPVVGGTPSAAPSTAPTSSPVPGGANPTVSPSTGSNTASPTAAGCSYSPNLVLAVSLVIITIKFF